MVTSNIGKPRGILRPTTGEKKFQLALHKPTQTLEGHIEHYWIVRWDLRGQEPYISETLPHPCVHLAIERGNTSIVGVMHGKFTRLLKENGLVFGIKFRPGAFYPFASVPASTFTDNTVHPGVVFGAEGEALEERLLTHEDDESMVRVAETFLSAHLPERDEQMELARQIAERILTDHEIISVEQLAQCYSMTARTLQRLFSQYIGVSPKWVIQRYRLHEAAERLDSGEVTDWTALALDLGYFDQAHFIKDFKMIVGTTPAAYTKHLDCTG